MENNKKYIKLGIFLVVFYIIFMIIYYFISTSSARSAASDEYLIFGIDTMWRNHNGQWLNTSEEEFTKALKEREFQIYSNNDYLGKSRLSLNGNTFNYIDSNNYSKTVYPSVLAYSSNSKTLVIENFNKSTLLEKDINLINEHLTSNAKVDDLDKLSINQKVSFDFDNDGEKEDLLLVSTLQNDYISLSEYVFRIVLYVDNGKVQEVYNDTIARTDTTTKATHIEVNSIIRFNSNEKYSIILNKSLPYGQLMSCPTLISLNNNNEWEELKTCQEVES